MAVQIQIRRDTAADWTSANPILAQGELGLEIDTARFKIGDGVLAWNSLLYANQVFSGPGAISANSSTAALTVTQIGSGPALLVEDSASPDSTPFVVTADGTTLVGNTATVNTPAGNAALQVTTSQSITRFSATSGAALDLGKSSSNTVGVNAVVGDGQEVGRIAFFGADGTNYIQTARIGSFVDGGPGTNDMPGRLVFSTTADGASSPTERMRITSGGQVGIGGTNVTVGAGRVHVVGDNSRQTLTLQDSAGPFLRFLDPSNAEMSIGMPDGQQALAVYSARNESGDGTERMRITAAGNVGIGTSGPDSKLAVEGSTSTAVQVKVNSDDTGAVPRLAFTRRNAANGATPNNAQIGSILWQGVHAGSGYTQFAAIDAVIGNNAAGGAPAALTFYLSQSGTGTTERMRIDSSGLITGTGTSLGAWTAYTPTLGGTGWAIGNGTAAGAYCQIGKVVHFHIAIIAGSTTTFGATEAATVTLPVTASNLARPNFIGRALDISASELFTVLARCASTTVAELRYLVSGTNGKVNPLVASAPFAFATSDEIRISGTYDAA